MTDATQSWASRGSALRGQQCRSTCSHGLVMELVGESAVRFAARSNAPSVSCCEQRYDLASFSRLLLGWARSVGKTIRNRSPIWMRVRNLPVPPVTSKWMVGSASLEGLSLCTGRYGLHHLSALFHDHRNILSRKQCVFERVFNEFVNVRFF